MLLWIFFMSFGIEMLSFLLGKYLKLELLCCIVESLKCHTKTLVLKVSLPAFGKWLNREGSNLSGGLICWCIHKSMALFPSGRNYEVRHFAPPQLPAMTFIFPTQEPRSNGDKWWWIVISDTMSQYKSFPP